MAEDWRKTQDEFVVMCGDLGLTELQGRTAISDMITESMHASGDFDSGISSSDVNHTIHGAMKSGYASEVLLAYRERISKPTGWYTSR